MTPREQLIQEVLQAPDFLVSALLKLLSEEASTERPNPTLIREGSALVVCGELPASLDINELVTAVRENRIRNQMGL